MRFLSWVPVFVGSLLVLMNSGCDESSSKQNTSAIQPKAAESQGTAPTPVEEKQVESDQAKMADSKAAAEPAIPEKTVKTEGIEAPDISKHNAVAKPVEAKVAVEKKEPETKKGADVSGAAFSAWLQAAGSYEAGKQGNVTVTLVSRDPYKCNEKYPYKFKLDPPTAGVSYPQDPVKGMQVDPKRSTMAIPFVPSQAGTATISGTLHFSVCTDERCLIEKTNLSVSVDVN